MCGKALRGNTLFFGDFGLVAVECGRITSKQIESARVAMTRYVKRGGKIWIRIFPDKSITKKPAETRMGSGKGNVEEWCAVIRPGRILYEMDGISRQEATEALRLAGHKLPLKVKVIYKTDAEMKASAAVKAAAAALKPAASKPAAAPAAGAKE